MSVFIRISQSMINFHSTQPKQNALISVTDECTNGFQRCDHGICIEKSLWCDGLNDCGDFSDELNCDDFTLAICADRTQFQCKSNRTICLAPSKRCDGRRDCPNGEDELDCHGDCDSSQFKCSNGECIRSDFVCDNAKGESPIRHFYLNISANDKKNPKPCEII